VSRERQKDRSRGRAASPRGRSIEPKKGKDGQHKISTLSKIGDILKQETQKEKEARDGWKEFKKGKFLIA